MFHHYYVTVAERRVRRGVVLLILEKCAKLSRVHKRKSSAFNDSKRARVVKNIPIISFLFDPPSPTKCGREEWGLVLYKFQFLAHYRFMLFRLLEKFADFAEELFFGGKLDNYFVKSLHRICHSGLNFI